MVERDAGAEFAVDQGWLYVVDLRERGGAIRFRCTESVGAPAVNRGEAGLKVAVEVAASIDEDLRERYPFEDDFEEPPPRSRRRR
jgi:hypothetical protein